MGFLLCREQSAGIENDGRPAGALSLIHIFLQGIKENIIRCVFHKKTEMNQESPLDIEAHAEADIDVRNHLKEIEICTERLKVSIEKDTGKFRWIDRKTGCLLLAEKEKELQEKVFEAVSYTHLDVYKRQILLYSR